MRERVIMMDVVYTVTSEIEYEDTITHAATTSIDYALTVFDDFVEKRNSDNFSLQSHISASLNLYVDGLFKRQIYHRLFDVQSSEESV